MTYVVLPSWLIIVLSLLNQMPKIVACRSLIHWTFWVLGILQTIRGLLPKNGSERPYLGEVPCHKKENIDGDEGVELKYSIELMDS